MGQSLVGDELALAELAMCQQQFSEFSHSRSKRCISEERREEAMKGGTDESEVSSQRVIKTLIQAALLQTETIAEPETFHIIVGNQSNMKYENRDKS